MPSVSTFVSSLVMSTPSTYTVVLSFVYPFTKLTITYLKKLVAFITFVFSTLIILLSGFSTLLVLLSGFSGFKGIAAPLPEFPVFPTAVEPPPIPKILPLMLCLLSPSLFVLLFSELSSVFLESSLLFITASPCAVSSSSIFKSDLA